MLFSYYVERIFVICVIILFVNCTLLPPLLDERYVAAESYQDALENLRVYDVVVNPLCPTVLGLATSAGVLVLSFLSRAPLGRVVGIHQLYGEMALTYSEGWSDPRYYTHEALNYRMAFELFFRT